MDNFMKAVFKCLRELGLEKVTTNFDALAPSDAKPGAYCLLTDISHNGIAGDMAEAIARLKIQVHSSYKGIREVLRTSSLIRDVLDLDPLLYEGGEASLKADRIKLTQEKPGHYVGHLNFEVWMRGGA